MTQRRQRRFAVGTATGSTRDPHVQQTRNLFTAGGVRFQGIPTRLVGEAEDQQEAHHNLATLHAPLHLPQPPVPPRNPNTRTRRRKSEKSEVRNKDDLAEIKSLRMIRGTSARPAKPHPQVEAGQIASHVAKRAELRKQRGKFVTQST